MYIKICLFLIIFFGLFLIPTSAKTPTLPYKTDYLIAKNDFVLKKVIQGESGGNIYAYNPKDTDGRPKYGLLQYGETEFYTWAEWAGIENPEIYSPEQQLLIWHWLAKNKPEYLRRWGTFVKLFP